MSDLEPDADFRERLLRIVSRNDRLPVPTSAGAQLDVIGRRCGRSRTGVPRRGLYNRAVPLLIDPPASRKRP